MVEDLEQLLEAVQHHTRGGPGEPRAMFERLKFVARALRAAPVVRPGETWLLRFDPEDKVQAVAVTAADLVIGRDSKCELVLTSPRVSRRHAAVRRAGGAAEIEDLGSSNGTRVNGHALVAREPRALRDGDLIEIGGLALVVAVGMPK